MTTIFDRMKDDDKNQVTELIEKRYTGKIIKISPKGWGFISSEEIPFTRIFFHWTALKQDNPNFTELEKGNKVEFSTMKTPDKGTRAIKIKVIK